MLTEEQEIQLWKYVDGEMSALEQEQFQAILQKNQSLLTELNVIEGIHRQLESNPLPQVSPSFTASVMGAIPEKRKSRSDLYWLVTCLSAMTIVAVALQFLPTDTSVSPSWLDFSVFNENSSFRYMLVLTLFPFLFLLDDYLKKRFSKVV